MEPLRSVLVASVCALMVFIPSLCEADGWHYNVVDYALWPSVYGDGRIRVVPATELDPDACDQPNDNGYFVQESLPNAVRDRILSTLMAAKLSGVPIDIHLDGCTGGGQAGSPVITAVVLDG